uniref:Uncharacterized protein n=1 Tax=Chromera velia CCMP2878 TaxID=1169474 RepID=A0A0G4I1W9_9ALVE|eukprot:Cvel_34888.t1-p1 / transcript=Cvel_34888.t1 / gene=Cvel_34888 / organism=Chromera_velia_CCMP2878 / gene_product=hypothetical protein / transcript_product=hypothetical protein / location=Cvel_scaffold6151:1583-2512(+) / protein_length=310 / sequence_SO=supercontig / SO=protein_coding / is_pseudo=false
MFFRALHFVAKLGLERDFRGDTFDFGDAPEELNKAERLQDIETLVRADALQGCGDCFCITEEEEPCPSPVFEPETVFSPSTIETFISLKLLNPFKDLQCNPYKDSQCSTTPPQQYVDKHEAVCAFKYATANTYSLVSYTSAADAAADGALVTHNGACGLCSTSQDLAAYLAHPDMTSEGKVCASKALFSSAWGKKCYEQLGFSSPCAAIWNLDGTHTGRSCFWTCIRSVAKGEPNNGPPPECQLNACLQCDEEAAGPIFQSFAGRTRRRSGLMSAIARGCADFARLHPSDALPPSLTLAADGSIIESVAM